LESSESKQLTSSAKSNYSAQISRVLAVSLFASLITLAPIVIPSAGANGLGPSTYLDGTCNIEDSDPANHLTPETAFVIDTVDKLWEVTDCTSASATVYFRIDRDLDANNAISAPTSSPIGYSTSGVSSFSGVLDGGGFTIRNISISSSVHGAGLFAWLNASTVSSLVLEGQLRTSMTNGAQSSSAGALAVRTSGKVNLEFITNSATVAGGWNVGGIVGYAAGELNLRSSSNLGEIDGSGEVVGGLVGYALDHAFLTDLSNQGQVDGVNHIGGLVGRAFYPIDIRASKNFGTISATTDAVGGLAGTTDNATTLTNVSNFGVVRSLLSSMAGGLIGQSTSVATILSASNQAKVSGVNKVGGLVGWSFGLLDVSSSHNVGQVSGSSKVGGIIGEAYQELKVHNSQNSGSVSATTDQAGGLVGFANGSNSIQGFSNLSQVGGPRKIGGLIGAANSTTTITSSSNAGQISGGEDTGGLVGLASGAITLDNAFNLASVTGNDNVAGLVGLAKSTVGLDSTLNSGAIDGRYYVGGLVGFAEAGLTLQDSFNTGPISGTWDVGGLAGLVGKPNNQTGDLNITNAYTSGEVSGTMTFDPVVGRVAGSTSAQGLYATADSQLVSASALSSMQNVVLYTGWDFTSVWGFGTCNENGGLPSLKFLGTFSVYYESGCFAPTPQSAEPEVEAPAPTYQGPIITPIKAEVNIGGELIITGSRLESVHRVLIGAAEQELVNVSSTEITIRVSLSSSHGVQDLILYSAFGSLTYQGSVNVISVTTEEEVVGSRSAVLITKTKLLSKDSTVAEAWLQGNLVGSGLSKVICTVTVASDATTHQRVQARKLAKESCSRAAAYLPGASVWFQTKATIHSRLTGRTFITFRG
jgi:hypothetical protein